MAKRTTRTIQHLSGKKGILLAERLTSMELEKVLIVPVEIGKSHHKACVADYFGSILKDPFEFHSSQEGIRLSEKPSSSILHNAHTGLCRHHVLPPG